MSAATKDDNILKNATSGGIVTHLTKYLLQNQFYDIAFLVDTFNYSDRVLTLAFNKNSNFNNTQKSRYIPVSHI
ncbi:MAG: coenzyme F420 hydrogenase/dehydrogenase beta subunit N-terminal domain-containing protein [bacterium]